MTDHDAILLEAEDNLKVMEKRLAFAQGNPRQVQFCSSCLSGTKSSLSGLSACCEARIISRAVALSQIRVAMVSLTQKIRNTKARIAEAAEEKKKPAKEPKPSTKVLGPITVVFSDTGRSVTLPDARHARIWLRRHGLSVVDAAKSGEFWNLATDPREDTND